MALGVGVAVKEPRTRAEWQEAVDQAEFYLVLDSARQYGLITGGPEVNVDRCEEILKHGSNLGFQPSPDAIERCAKVLCV